MNARLIKETRELLPVFGGMLLLIIVSYLIWHDAAAGLICVVLTAGCAALAASSFGHEFQYRTLPLLLAQPIARSVLWRDKMLVLGAAMIVSLAVAEVGQLAVASRLNADVGLTPVVIALCAFCGAPYWTLVLRHGMHGIACAVGAPLALLAVLALIFERFGIPPLVREAMIATLILVYCTVFYWRGYKLFLRLEDVERPGRELRLPAGLESVLARPLAGIGSRFRGPFASLLKKELRLQQVCFLLTGVFVLFAVVGFCLIPIHKGAGIGTVGSAYAFFVVLLPLVAGTISLAEEKGWDLAEWHLTLPPSALNQWSAKMLATLSTSLLLGLLLPSVMFLAGAIVLNPRGSGAVLPPASRPILWVLGQMLVTSVAVYAASFSRSTIKAVLASFGLILASVGVLVLAGRCIRDLLNWLRLNPLHGQVDLVTPVLAIGFVLLLCLTQWLAWSNFRRFGSPPRRLVIQLLVLFLAVALVSLALVAAMFLAPVPSGR